MLLQPDEKFGVVQASAYTGADKQHWEAIHRPLPPAPGEKKNSGQPRDRDTALSTSCLNIGEFQRWVLLRDENLEDRSETLRHDILWHFLPHKACWAKCSEPKSSATTPRSKNSTPSNTPLAGSQPTARSKGMSFGALGMNSTGKTGSAVGGGAVAHKRSLNSSFCSQPVDLFTTPPSTVQRKKQTL
jgi:hypothetical protein